MSDTIEVKCKSWFDDVAQNFEALFAEVNDAVRQEIISVTNKLQSALQFCSDVVEELPLPLENTETESAPEIEVEDFDSLMIRTVKDHCGKESCNDYNLQCTVSEEHTDGILFDKCIDIRVYDIEKSDVIGNDNLVKENQFHHETSDLVASKEEESHELEEEKLLRHEILNVVPPEEEESNNFEDAYSYISSAAHCSDYSSDSCESLVLGVQVTPADPSTTSPDVFIAKGISHEEDSYLELERCPMLEENCEDQLYNFLVAKDKEAEKCMNEDLEAISRRQQAHISYLRQVQPHYSMMKMITQNLDRIVQEEEDNLRGSTSTAQENESCDSDWVIV